MIVDSRQAATYRQRRGVRAGAVSNLIGTAGEAGRRVGWRTRAGRRVSFNWRPLRSGARCSDLPRRGIKFNGSCGRGQADVSKLIAARFAGSMVNWSAISVDID